MIYALLLKNVTSRIHSLLLAKFAKLPGLGGGGAQPIFLQCQDFGCIQTPNPSLNDAMVQRCFEIDIDLNVFDYVWEKMNRINDVNRPPLLVGPADPMLTLEPAQLY